MTSSSDMPTVPRRLDVARVGNELKGLEVLSLWRSLPAFSTFLKWVLFENKHGRRKRFVCTENNVITLNIDNLLDICHILLANFILNHKHEERWVWSYTCTGFKVWLADRDLCAQPRGSSLAGNLLFITQSHILTFSVWELIILWR